MTQLALKPADHPAWPRLTDDQRQGVNELWDELVAPALEREDAMRRERDDALIDAQGWRDAHRLFREDLSWHASHMPVHDTPAPQDNDRPEEDG